MSTRSGRAVVVREASLPSLERSLAAVSIADADCVVDGGHEDLAIADSAGARAGAEHSQDWLYQRIGDYHLQLQLRQQVDFVLVGPVDFGVPLLPAVPSHLHNRDSFGAGLRQRVLDLVELVGLNDRLDLFHGFSLAGRYKRGTQTCIRRGPSIG